MQGPNPHRLNRFERQLLKELKANETPIPIEGSSVTLKRTPYGFVLEYGFSYEPCCLPPNIEFGEPKRCFDNAYKAVLHGELVYCEGFALGQSGLPVGHAWLTDGTGRAIDITWRERGRAYLGVPLKTIYVLETSMRNLPDEGFIEDWRNKYPLLMDLGDRPEEWLESNGCGVRKITL